MQENQDQLESQELPGQLEHLVKLDLLEKMEKMALLVPLGLKVNKDQQDLLVCKASLEKEDSQD